MKDKISKKATLKIIKVVQKIDPSKSKLTTFDEAWDIIATKYGFYGNLITKSKGDTIFELLLDDEANTKIYQFNWPNDKVFECGDWDWSVIYKDVLEFIIKNKLFTKKKIDKFIKAHLNEL